MLDHQARFCVGDDFLDAIHRGQRFGTAVIEDRNAAVLPIFTEMVKIAEQDNCSRLLQLDLEHLMPWSMARCLKDAHGTIAKYVVVATYHLCLRGCVVAERRGVNAKRSWFESSSSQASSRGRPSLAV